MALSTEQSPLSHSGLLNLTLRPGDSLFIGEIDDVHTELVITGVKGNQVRVGTRTKSKSTPINRDVVWERKLIESKQKDLNNN